MKVSFFLISQILVGLLYCQIVFAGTANPALRKATHATPVCDGGYVKTLEVDQSSDADDTGTILFSLSGGASFTYNPAWTENKSGGLVYVAPAPYAWVTLLTASYVNQKPICYTVDDSNSALITSLSFQ